MKCEPLDSTGLVPLGRHTRGAAARRSTTRPGMSLFPPTDVALFLALATLPTLSQALGTGRFLIDWPAALSAISLSLAAAGVLVCLLTRSREPAAVSSGRDMLARLALCALVALTLSVLGGLAVLPPAAAWLVGIATLGVLVASLVSVVGGHRLPMFDGQMRSLAVMPLVLLGTGAYQDFVDRLTILDLQWVASTGSAVVSSHAVLGIVLFSVVLAVLVVLTGLFYLLLVIAPRELAQPGTERRTWLIRFGLFLASLLIGSALVPFAT